MPRRALEMDERRAKRAANAARREAVAAAFEEHDVNSDCILEFEEFKSFLLQTRLLALQDNNKDGVVEEFGIDQNLFRLLARYFFTKADTDGDGIISVDEIQQVLKHYGFEARRAESVFEKYDANGDGGIDETEFRGLLIEEGIVRPVEDEPSSTCTLL